MRPVATARGLARAALPGGARRALEAREYARAPAIVPAALEGLALRAPGGYAAHYADGYEPGLAAALRALVTPGAVCADVGMHLGYFTLLMAARSGPDGRVTGFEASAPNAAAARSSVALNGLEDRVRVEHAAVTARHGTRVALYAGRGGGDMEWSASADFAAREDGRRRRAAMTVDGVALDAVFGDRLDVLKIDVEGAEGEVLHGARRLLREARPAIVLEFHRPHGWPAIAELRAAGYALSDLHGTPVAEPVTVASVPYQLVARPPASG